MEKNRKLSKPPGSFCKAFSFSRYQSLINCVPPICMILNIKDLMRSSQAEMKVMTSIAMVLVFQTVLHMRLALLEIFLYE